MNAQPETQLKVVWDCDTCHDGVDVNVCVACSSKCHSGHLLRGPRVSLIDTGCNCDARHCRAKRSKERVPPNHAWLHSLDACSKLLLESIEPQGKLVSLSSLSNTALNHVAYQQLKLEEPIRKELLQMSASLSLQNGDKSSANVWFLEPIHRVWLPISITLTEKAPVKSITLTKNAISVLYATGVVYMHSLWDVFAPTLLPIEQSIREIKSFGEDVLYLTDKGELLQGRTSEIPRSLDCPVVFRSIACGSRHALAIAVDGGTYAWGNGADGKLGHGNQDDVASPLKVAALDDHPALSIACGDCHSIVVTDEGFVITTLLHQFNPCSGFTWGMGSGRQGQNGCGLGSCQVPSRIESLDGKEVVQAVSSAAYAGVLTKEGLVGSLSLLCLVSFSSDVPMGRHARA